jgi:hypothetical protein
MNQTLIAIGMRGGALRRRAVAVADAIGPVVVDHGRTSCVTPDARAYIERAAARSKATTKAAGATR